MKMELHMILKLTKKKEISLFKSQQVQKIINGNYISDQIALEDKNVLI